MIPVSYRFTTTFLWLIKERLGHTHLSPKIYYCSGIAASLRFLVWTATLLKELNSQLPCLVKYSTSLHIYELTDAPTPQTTGEKKHLNPDLVGFTAGIYSPIYKHKKDLEPKSPAGHAEWMAKWLTKSTQGLLYEDLVSVEDEILLCCFSQRL